MRKVQSGPQPVLCRVMTPLVGGSRVTQFPIHNGDVEPFLWIIVLNRVSYLILVFSMPTSGSKYQVQVREN